ncbi:MAG: Omp28-related outer membrane protein [Ignavibacteria bacterium]|nr:Omp28-related outer membrane protein [Ignavibacteria bacterium]
MKHFKFLILSFLTFPVLFFTGCESNDNPSGSVYIPQPVNKKVLVEFFTNAGCNPCIAAHNYLDQIVAAGGVTINDTSVVIISYHTKYPFILDSLYRANIEHNQGRADYYGVNYTPQARLNGNINLANFSASDSTAQINFAFNTTRYLNIALSNDFSSSSDSGTVPAVITPVNQISATDLVLHIVITENHVPYITAPNGIKYPNDVMRYMITGRDGEAISLGSGITVTKRYGIAQNWKEDDCYLNVFVQSTSSKEIFGVEKIKVTSSVR